MIEGFYHQFRGRPTGPRTFGATEGNQGVSAGRCEMAKRISKALAPSP